MKRFGALPDGREVGAYALSAHGLSITVLDLGCILQDVRLDGVAHSLTIGSAGLDAYLNGMQFHGSVVGPVANRLSDAAVPIDGRLHHFDRNLIGRHTLHSGSTGVQQKIWMVREHHADSICMVHDMPDGEGGFPGNRHLTAWFNILPGPCLQLSLTTTSDAPSLANATNHSYWNLDGTGHLRDHIVQIDADEYLPSDADSFPTGEIAPLDGTDFDFRTPRRFVPNAPPLDNTYCVARHRGPLQKRMTLRGGSGVSMTVATTEPGVHLYDGRPTCDGLAIECQGWPDAPNKSGFPPIDVSPDHPVVQITQWWFSIG